MTTTGKETIPTVIIISGSPGTGKTTLSKHVAQILHVPVIHRDAIKETIFDSLGWSDRAWSKKTGITSYRLLYYFLEVLLQTRCHFMVESNFSATFDTPQFMKLQQLYPYNALQIVCHTDLPVLVERLRHRSQTAERHPGHSDHEEMATLTPDMLIGEAIPLGLDGPVLSIDTTDFTATNYIDIAQEVQQHMNCESMAGEA